MSAFATLIATSSMSGQSRRTRSQLPLADTVDFDPNTSPFKKARNLAKQNASPVTVVHGQEQAGSHENEDESLLGPKSTMPRKRSSSPFDQDERDWGLGSSTDSSRRAKKAKTDEVTGSFSPSSFPLMLLFSDHICRRMSRPSQRPINNPLRSQSFRLSRYHFQ